MTAVEKPADIIKGNDWKTDLKLPSKDLRYKTAVFFLWIKFILIYLGCY